MLALALALLPAMTTAATCSNWTVGLSFLKGGKRGAHSVTAGRRSTIIMRLRNPGTVPIVNATLILDMPPGIGYTGRGAKQATDGSPAASPSSRHANNGKGLLVVKSLTDLLWFGVNLKPGKTRNFCVKTKVDDCMPTQTSLTALAFFDLDDSTPVHEQDCLITAQVDVRAVEVWLRTSVYGCCARNHSSSYAHTFTHARRLHLYAGGCQKGPAGRGRV